MLRPRRPGRPCFGSEEIGGSAEVRTEVTDDKVRVVRWTIDVPAQPTYEFLGHYEANVDRWQIIEFQPPVYHFVDTGAVVTGTGAPEGEPGTDRVNVRVCHAITPETERTSHYFWSVAHELGEVTSDPAAREDYYTQMRQVIGEDVTVLEAQQRSMDIHSRGSCIGHRCEYSWREVKPLSRRERGECRHPPTPDRPGGRGQLPARGGDPGRFTTPHDALRSSRGEGGPLPPPLRRTPPGRTGQRRADVHHRRRARSMSSYPSPSALPSAALRRLASRPRSPEGPRRRP